MKRHLRENSDIMTRNGERILQSQPMNIMNPNKPTHTKKAFFA